MRQPGAKLGLSVQLALIGLLFSASAFAEPLAEPVQIAISPPVPGQLDLAYITPQPVSSLPRLNLITAVQMMDGELRIIAPPGSELLVKGRFLLANPNRLVIDIDNAELADKALTLPPGRFGNQPYAQIRLGQFDATTVRVVIESPAPDKLDISLGRGGNNLLRVYSPRMASFPARFFGRFFGGPQPQPSAQRPQPSYAPLPARPLMVEPPRIAVGGPLILPDTPQSRIRILEIARSQLGVSKALARDYVINTFSMGKDEAWCADFVSTILTWAGSSPWGHTALVKDIYDWGLRNDRLKPFPEPGDVAIFRYGVSSFDHTAFVESINPDNTFTTIGGNEGGRSGQAPGGMVQRNHYKLEDPRVVGYVDPL